MRSARTITIFSEEPLGVQGPLGAGLPPAGQQPAGRATVVGKAERQIGRNRAGRRRQKGVKPGPRLDVFRGQRPCSRLGPGCHQGQRKQGNEADADLPELNHECLEFVRGAPAVTK